MGTRFDSPAMNGARSLKIVSPSANAAGFAVLFAAPALFFSMGAFVSETGELLGAAVFLFVFLNELFFCDDVDDGDFII